MLSFRKGFFMNIIKYLSDNVLEMMRRRATGLEIVRRLSDIVDDLINDSLHYVLKAFLSNVDLKQSQIAVIATGGYGRRELTAYSDVDIMLLGDKRDESICKIAEALFYHLWDMGMNISHSFRTLDECLEDAMKDITIRTSLMESRFIGGDEHLFIKYKKEIYQKIVNRNKSLFIKDIMQECDKRHRKSGDSAYLLEPDIKDGRGGLRDMHTLRWLAKVSFRLTETGELSRIIPEKEYIQLIKAYDFLIKIRVCLHLIARRRNDSLSFEFHEPVAKMMGIKTTKRYSAAEILMRLYYKKADHIFRALSKIMHLSQASYIQIMPNFSVKKLSPNFLLSKNVIIVKNQEILKSADNIIEAFYIYSQTGREFSYQLKSALHNKSIQIRQKKNISKNAIIYFLKILKSGRVYDTLRQMHDTLVLDRLIPEFGSLRHLVIYEPCHKYTVDEHTLISIKNLENLKNTKDEKCQYLRKIFKGIKQEVLFFAILLHDVGKGIRSSFSKRHEEKGYKAIKSILERFDLPASDRQKIEFLVKNHLILPKLALTRDIDAPETITSLCEIAETEENLKYLLLMSYADMTAVNPHFWTDWKAYLLFNLINKASSYMQGILQKKFETSDPEVIKFLEDMPQRYLISNSFNEMLEDFRMAQKIHDSNVLISINPRADGTAEVVVVTSDMLGLFLRIVRVLSSQGLNIIRARLYCSRRGFVVDKILLSNWSDIWWEGLEIELKEKLKNGISQNLKELFVYSNNIRYESKISELRLFEHFIEIDNETSKECSILEITSPDRLGLLYEIASQLFLNHIDITSAIINTEEGFAQDTFYIQYGGRKLDDETVFRVLDSIYNVIFKSVNSIK